MEEYIDIAHRAVVDTAQDFHFTATTDDGRQLEVPFGYQIEEPGFRPFRSGKATPDELRAEFGRIVNLASERGVSIGIEGYDSVRKISIQMGLGVDCSNFAYRALSLVHDRMNLPDYTQTVFRAGEDIRALHATKKPSWDANDENGEPRQLTGDENIKLETGDLLDVDWLTKVFNKDPQFVLGSTHMCDDNATEKIQVETMLPGDLIAFTKTGSGIVSHVAVVEQVLVDDGHVHADFWHSWHTRDFESGLRRDSVTIVPDQTMSWSHEGLDDPARYIAHSFRRPAAMAMAYTALAS